MANRYRRLPPRRNRATAEAMLAAGGVIADLQAERARRSALPAQAEPFAWLFDRNGFEYLPDWPSREYAEILATIFTGKLPAVAETWRL